MREERKEDPKGEIELPLLQSKSKWAKLDDETENDEREIELKHVWRQELSKDSDRPWIAQMTASEFADFVDSSEAASVAREGFKPKKWRKQKH